MLTAIAKNTTGSEEERLKVLRHYRVIDPVYTASLQNLVQLIAEEFCVPVAAVSLVDSEEIHVKASTGVHGLAKLDRKFGLCSFVVDSGEITVFENAKKEPLLCSNPFVHHEPGIGFYAGAPLVTKEGARVGSLCIVDHQERNFSTQEEQRLRRFAQCVMNELELIATIQQRTAKLEEKELQLHAAFEMAKIGSWEFDVETKTPYWSDDLYKIYALERKAVGHDLLTLYMNLIHPDDHPKAQARLADSETAPESIIERIIRKDGKLVHVHQLRRKVYNAEGKLIKIAGIAQDVTDRIVYEQKLKESEERFKALVQNSSDMIVVLDESGNIKYISPTSLAISGFEAAELIGRNVFEFVHEADMPILIAELQEVAKSTNSGEPTLHRLRTKDGGWIWLESKGMNMMNNSHVGGIIINARDVTERIRLEERLAVEQQNYQRGITSAVIKAQETERSQLGRELHDNINQVLTTVKLYIEMIRDGIGDQKELVKKAGRHLQGCIDEIRSISKRLSVPTLGEICLEDSIKELIASINLTNRIEIIYSGQEIAGLQLLQELHLAIYRIVQEQLNNIIKYAAASLVFITLKKREGLLILHITDNGRGFDVTAKRTGIGITNMRTRAENLGGDFRMESSPGKGCQLQVHFPLQYSGKVLAE